MTTTTKLTGTQRLVLEHATGNPDGAINWFPDNVKGGARQKVIDGLFSRDLITSNGIHDCFITAEGYDALGQPRPGPAPIAPSPEVEAAVAEAKATWAQEKQEAAQQLLKVGVEGKPRMRDNTKQAQVLAMLRRPSGATLADICKVTEWQVHTCRGFLAGAVKKKLGLTITSTKEPGSDRCYRIG